MSRRGSREVVADYVANVGDWIRGNDQAIDAVRKLDRETDRAADDVDDAYDKMSASARRYADQAERAGRDAADGVGRGVRGGKLKEAGSEVGAEFTESFGEAVRSGNPAQAITDTVTSLGPALGLAGLFAAAGAGVVLSFIQAGQEKAAEVKALAGSMFDAFRDGILEASEKEDLLVEVLGLENAQQAYSKVGELARTLGLDAATLTEQIIAGTLDAESLEARVAAVDDLVNGRARVGRGGPNVPIPQQLRDSKAAAEELLTVQDKVKQSAQDYRDALGVANDIARQKLIPALRDAPPMPGPYRSGYVFERP